MLTRILIFFWNLYLIIKNKILFKIKSEEIRLYKRWDINIEGFKLNFDDDFNKKAIKSYWRTDSYTGQRFDENQLNLKHVEFYSDNCFDFNSTTILLKSCKLPKKLKVNDIEYKADVHIGQLDSSLYFMQTYGYFEFRVKMPKSNNIKTNIKLHSLLTGSDILVNQYKGNKCNSCFNVGVNNKIKTINTGLDLAKNFFTYSINWNKKYLKFYFQGILVRVMKTPKDFIHPMHMILKNGINNNSIEGTIFPNTLNIDYVRVYEKIEKDGIQ
jgi:beta-glucanase (GH16 family)